MCQNTYVFCVRRKQLWRNVIGFAFVIYLAMINTFLSRQAVRRYGAAQLGLSDNSPHIQNPEAVMQGRKRESDQITQRSSSADTIRQSLGQKFYLTPDLFCYDKDPSPRTFDHGKYTMHANYIGPGLSSSDAAADAVQPHCNATVTYTTHGNYLYLRHVIDVLERWEGIISVAVFAPGYDYERSLRIIFHLRQCVQLSEKIRTFVTFHMFYNVEHRPAYILNHEELKEYKINCSSQLPDLNGTTYKETMKLDYPINVARNLARKSANSYFILPSDIELLPSPNTVPRFLQMISGQPRVLHSSVPRVFVLPIFEVKRNARLPQTKQDLLLQLRTSTAVVFHIHTCPKCQRIPKHDQWVRTAINDTHMTISHTSKRAFYPLFGWEPIFICTHDAPLYDERLSWEGRKDKMPQALELCLLDYDFHILSNAFLVHRGIKKSAEHLTREHKQKIWAQTKFVQFHINPELRAIHGFREGCEHKTVKGKIH